MNKISFYKRYQPHMPLIILLVICFAVRIISGIQWFTNASIMMELDKPSMLIYSHPWQSFLFQHSTPPLGTLFNAAVYALGKPVSLFVMMGMNLILSAIAAAFMFLSCRALNVGVGISFALTLGYSIAMMRVRQGLYWLSPDDLVYTFLPLFIWNLIMHQKVPHQRHDLYCGILSGLMLWTSTVPGVVALFITVVVVIFQRTPKRFFRRIASVLIPFVLLFLLCLKNYYSVGIFNICTKGGQNGLQMILLINAWPPEKLYDFAKNETRPPSWWQWCYSQGKYNVENVYGRCYGECSAPDYGPLYQVLSAIPEKQLAQRVLDDARDDKRRPWIFYLPSDPGLNRRFSAHYNVQSQKIWLDFILKKPVTFIYGIMNNTNKFFVYDGPLFGFNQGGYKGLGVFDTLTRVITFGMLPVFYGGIGAAYLSVVALFFSILKNLKRKFSAADLLGLGFVVSNLIFVIATCCENNRYFWMAAPYLIPLSAFMIETLLRNHSLTHEGV